ncbi:solute carrier family 28 member 3-like isoform X2 [Xenia sp. Carnegie-2017]|nr:solute carrier family 28 member 3-like isoform X2 [Xenia sp. Carnegie-2017]
MASGINIEVSKNDVETKDKEGIDNPGFKTRMANKDRSGDTLLRLSSNAPNYSTAVEIELDDSANQSTNEKTPQQHMTYEDEKKKPLRKVLGQVWRRHWITIVVAALDFIVIIYSIFGIMKVGFTDAAGLFGIGVFVWFCLTWMVFYEYYGAEIQDRIITPFMQKIDEHWTYLKWLIYGVLSMGIIVFLAVDTRKKPIRFLSLFGLAVYVFIAYIFSKHRSKIIWRPVLWGFALQFIFGLLILRTTAGRKSFKFVGDQISIFLDYTDYGAVFVFGSNFKEHFFVFKVLPVIIFFSSVISVLYYLRIMPMVIKKIAWLMHVTMKTSGSESLNAAGNIFIGQTEAPLMVRPFLESMTMSELHAVMTGGFATIAGGVLAAYISFGVSPSHLLSASVMSAPAALAISKVMYPETEESETKTSDDIDVPKMKEVNVIEAAASGASNAIPLVANIAANLIAFLAFLAFIDAVLSYVGSVVDYPDLSFKFICSWILRPFAFIMGVDWDDCGIVGELLGTKTFANEFIAYLDLSHYIENAKENNGGRTITERSQIIATYALCGFSNFSSIGIQIGGMGPLAPSRRSDLAVLALRALLAGTLACFMTACIAG